MQEKQNYSHKTWHVCTEIVSNGCSRISFKDTHMEKALSNKTPALSASMNMDFWVVGTSNQLFIAGYYTETNFQKNMADTGKTTFFVIGPFCTPHSIRLNIDFWESERVFVYGYVTLSIVVLSNTKRFSSFLKKRLSFFRKFISKSKY